MEVGVVVAVWFFFFFFSLLFLFLFLKFSLPLLQQLVQMNYQDCWNYGIEIIVLALQNGPRINKCLLCWKEEKQEEKWFFFFPTFLLLLPCFSSPYT